jgi:hypothetical protein
MFPLLSEGLPRDAARRIGEGSGPSTDGPGGGLWA